MDHTHCGKVVCECHYQGLVPSIGTDAVPDDELWGRKSWHSVVETGKLIRHDCRFRLHHRYVLLMERYVIRGGVAGYQRLQLLARVLLPATSALFDRVGVEPGRHCLDLGCGAGDATFELARRVGPTGWVTGIDMDVVKLQLARREATRQQLANVDFRVSNVYQWSAPNSYDLVYSRNLLQHLGRPIDVVGAMWAAVRVGGLLIVEDADFDGAFCDPPNHGFDFWIDSYQRVLTENGGDPLSGRKLHRYFRAVGIPQPEIAVIQRVDLVGEAKLLPHSTLEATAEAVMSAGIATPEQVADALVELTEFAGDGHSLYGSPREFQAWCRRVD